MLKKPFFTKLNKSYKIIDKCNSSKKHFYTENYLRMVYLPHRSHEKAIWAMSGFHLQNWPSPIKSFISATCQKITISAQGNR